ncbi:universal stress protein [Saxibacter everestensis]|uniref:Universal stress protein n=1 Tax=Saxibacter everestensis TaxID=2909229 RepID=A0ABY8QUV1_9MICO|nr:universal stress protein [Brevibacteriaceae bacterium ZFBP1038]
MKYVVGYSADERGKEALALAISLAKVQGASLDVVVVLPKTEPFNAAYPPAPDFDSVLTDQANTWLDTALATIPETVSAQKHVRFSSSTAEGLIEAAAELDAGLIVIGAARGGMLSRYSVGSVANALLHAASTPIALAPRGWKADKSISRLTCAIGTRAGAEALLDVAIDSAARRRLPLRLVSLVAVSPDGAAGIDRREQAKQHAEAVLAQAVSSLPEGAQATATVGEGNTIEDAVEALDFDPAEIVLIGSSRLAERHKLFLGVAANKMLRVLPVPIIVVPRDYGRAMPGRSEEQA